MRARAASIYSVGSRPKCHPLFHAAWERAICIRAERKAGQLLAEIDRSKGGRPLENNSCSENNSFPTDQKRDPLTEGKARGAYFRRASTALAASRRKKGVSFGPRTMSGFSPPPRLASYRSRGELEKNFLKNGSVKIFAILFIRFALGFQPAVRFAK